MNILYNKFRKEVFSVLMYSNMWVGQFELNCLNKININRCIRKLIHNKMNECYVNRIACGCYECD